MLVTYRRLLGYLAPHKAPFALGILGGTVYAASTASFAWLAKKFGDGTFTHPDPRMVFLIPIALVIIFIGRGLGSFTQTYFMGYVGRQIVKRLRVEVFRSVLDLPAAYFDRASTGTLLSRLTYNSEQVGQASTDSIVIMVRAALTVIGDDRPHLLVQLAPGADRARDRTARRVADLGRQSELQALRSAHSGFDG